jgi:hypothetical protein
LGYLILVREIPGYLRFAEEGVTGTTASRNAANELVLLAAPGRPAARAGVIDGDVLLAVDGVAVDPSRELTDLGLRGPVGSTVVVDVRRNGNVRRIPIVRSDDLAAVNRELGITNRGRTWYLFLFDLLPTITFTFVGAFVLLRGWHRPLGVLLALAFFLFATGWTNVLVLAASTGLAAKIVVFAAYLGTGAIFALFPDVRLAPRWGGWIIVGWGAIALMSAIHALALLIPDWLEAALWTLVVGTGVVAQLARYRSHSDDLQRRQIKLVVLSFAAAFVAFVLTRLPATYMTTSGRWEAFYRFELLANPLVTVTVAPIPVAIAVAVSKHGLWNVHALINRSAVYSLVTIVLGTIWAATAVLLQATLNLFIGQYSTIAAAAVSSLQVAALFQPLKTRTQAWVDRRFPRESYVVEQKLQQLAREVAHSFDVDVIPFVDRRLQSILGSDDVRWHDGGVRATASNGRLESEEIRRALDAFAQTAAPYIAIREAMKRALKKDAALPQ